MLSKFDLHEIVAQSAESVVFAGEDLEAGRAMALRRYLARRNGKRGVADEVNFFAEVAKVRGLEEAHVVGILDAGFDAQDKNPYFLTRLVEGEVLTQILDGSSLAQGDARKIVEEALDGLQQLHEMGAVHGGLRADRLRWSRTAGVSLTDAGMEPALLKLGDFKKIGDERSTAPELRKTGKRSVAGDFYALGATVYELLAGMPAPVEGRWPSLGAGLAHWDGWLRTMVAADPRARPANCADAGAMFAAAMAVAADPARDTAKQSGKTAAPLLTRVPAAGASAAARKIPPVGEWKPALNITGLSPVVALPSTKRRWISPVWVATVLLLLGVAGGGYFLGNREKFSSLAGIVTPGGKPSASAPVPLVAPPAAAQEPTAEPQAPEVAVQPPFVEPVAPTPVEPVEVIPVPEPAVIASAPPAPPINLPPVAQRATPPMAQPGGAANEVFGPRDNGPMLAQLGKPGVISGTVRQIGGSKSGAYLDIQFDGGECMAYIRVAREAVINPADFQVFKSKKVEIRGVIDTRPWSNNRERPSIRFLSIEDIKVVSP